MILQDDRSAIWSVCCDFLEKVLLRCMFNCVLHTVVYSDHDVMNINVIAGEGGKAREHKTSLHAIRSIMRNEGIIGMYTG